MKMKEARQKKWQRGLRARSTTRAWRPRAPGVKPGSRKTKGSHQQRSKRSSMRAEVQPRNPKKALVRPHRPSTARKPAGGIEDRTVPMAISTNPTVGVRPTAQIEAPRITDAVACGAAARSWKELSQWNREQLDMLKRAERRRWSTIL
ncbi:MAG: hypothetical protein BJ554DRAFT_5911, partial [Olpidium bornovanus]